MTKNRSDTNGRRGLVLLAALAVAVAGAAPLLAQDMATLEEKRTDTASEYETVLRQMSLSKERLDSLAGEVAAMRKDNTAITSALIQAAKTEKKLSNDIAAIEVRLETLKQQEDALKASLHARRGVLAEVLGALQRMGLNPPPAILVRPEDALSSVRSAIILGAVVPELRAETEILLGDLKELAALRSAIAGERETLFATVQDQAAEKKRLALLLEEKSRLLRASESTLDEEREKAAALAAKAGTLKELIASIEAEITGVQEAARAARLAEEERKRREAEAAGRPVPEANRLVTGLPFESLEGTVALPVSGTFVRRFGESDGLGGHMAGDTLQTQSGSIVTAPADGSILYAGPFRSYGQLLIVDVGDGYHVVLAGMATTNVSLGQTVLSGEPIGAMGEARVASAVTLGSANSSPELYVEFRKDGKPVDPAPWWADRDSGRTKDDS
ncbi:murein hydrolase activator EnvC family protein [Nitratireductor alexandrii]|uniref:murein hydrolase activator EnvC family protein n=1 Tax=Nitratireductor alexandrii TaxID=2448161 RepID=UPI000FD8C607|nr:murein hydrolase activator EnvC [Nitratireductor alexandrii]